MITREEAISIVGDYWNKDVQDSGDEFYPASAELTEEKDYWMINGNSKSFITDGIELKCMVGISGFIVDAHSGDLSIAGSLQDPYDILQDCRDDKLAGEKRYVLAGGLGRSDATEITQLRGLFPCGISRARELLSEPERFWFTGKLRYLQSYQKDLMQQGMITEILILDDVSEAIEVHWLSDLKSCLHLLSKRI